MALSTVGLPPEVLYDVVGLVFSEHLDALVAGKRMLKHVPPSDANVDGNFGGGDSGSEGMGELEGAGGEPSAIASLLQAAFQIRHVTLKVLADALGIALDCEGIGR